MGAQLPSPELSQHVQPDSQQYSVPQQDSPGGQQPSPMGQRWDVGFLHTLDCRAIRASKGLRPAMAPAACLPPPEMGSIRPGLASSA